MSDETKVEEKREAIGDYTQIRLGDLVREVFSGKLGFATERQYHLNGCSFLNMEVKDDPEKSIMEPIQRFELIESRPQFHPADETMENSHVKLGDQVKDTLSGFKGHAVGWAVPLFGSHRIFIDPGMDKDGAMGKTTFFDECRVKVVKAKDPPSVPEAKRPAAKERGCLPGVATKGPLSR